MSVGGVHVVLEVNGDKRALVVEPHATLLWVLRDGLGLNGVLAGCEAGDCGACAVLLDGKAVPSCVVLAASAEGARIETIEGLAHGWELHPIQQAFVDHHGMQCGFCTPGAILAAKALLDENPAPDEQAVREALSGNLCRCGSYPKMVRSVLAAARAMAGRAEPASP